MPLPLVAVDTVVTFEPLVLPVSSSDPNYGTGFKAKRLTLSGGLLHGVTAAADRLKGQGAWIVYDLEGARPGPNVPKELQDELKDYVSSVKTAGDAVHKNGGKLMFTPTYPDILKYGARFAPYCDMINMQISSYTPGYAARVKETAQILRAANPKAIVLVQLGAISQTSPKQNTDPKQAIEAWKSVRSIVDGVLPYYVNDPNPIPMLKQFCDAILNQ